MGDGDDETRTYPGARRPDRSRRVDGTGVSLAVHEWGDPDARPLLLAHGGFDFAGTYDVFAPKLAAAGWRVVCWDQRGHGDSERAALYQWEADMRDAVAVLDSVTDRPIPVVGHSKGGSLTTHLSTALPHRVSAVVNIDGIPSRRAMPDVHEKMSKAGHRARVADFGCGCGWSSDPRWPAKRRHWSAAWRGPSPTC